MIAQLALMVSMLLLPAAAEPEPLSPAEQVALLDRLSPSLVRVEYTLQYDKGEAPAVRGCIERCPNCGNYHLNSADDVVRDERPLEAAGFLLSPTQVLTADPLAHPRFVKGITARYAKGTAKAEIAAYVKGQNAIILKLSEPLAQATPLAFDAAKKGPYLAVTYQKLNGEWAAQAGALSMKLTSTESGRRFFAAPSQCVLVARDGTPVGACMKEQLPCDDTWKGSPESWPSMSAAEMAAALRALEERCSKCLLRVSLSFRSPKAQERSGYRGFHSEGDEENATERNVTGLLLDEKRVLILAQLPAKITARLERVVVHPAAGKGVAAKFASTLTDYGALVATLDEPLEGAVTICSQPISDFRDTFLLSADVAIKGEARVAYFGHERITGFDTGWKQRIYPQLPGDGESLFLFDTKMALAAMPVSQRDKVTVREEWSSTRAAVMPAAYLQEAVADLPKQADPNNVPLSEVEESRVAWMGVEMQSLGRELARANNVSDRTSDGEMGGLVTFVYPGSPAAAAGIEPGYILLRLHVESQPKPLEVRLQDDRYGGADSFPWDRLDDVPAEYFEQLPKPWPSVENSFTLALTDLGFGKKYTAEFFSDGKAISKEFQVAISPPHFDSAPRHKSEPLGLTVRNLTYEVRRYFQKKDDDLGVIVSKIEPGGKAAVAGLLPYEIITHVNDSPVTGVKDFERLIADQKQLRLSVSRKAQGRIVKIDMTTATRPAGKGLLSKLRSGLGRPGATAVPAEVEEQQDADEAEDESPAAPGPREK